MDLPPELLGRGGDVAAARFEVTYAFDDGSSPAVVGELRLHPVLEAWDEAALTWSQRPAYGAEETALTSIAGYGTLELDVTGLVRDWLDGATPNHGVVLRNPTARTLGMHSLEASVDAALRPALVIEVLPAPGAAALLGVAAASAALRRRSG